MSLAERQTVAEASRLCSPQIHYFDPDAPIAFLSGDLPHWRQQGVTYFVTFRLADSLPAEKLLRWQNERAEWIRSHPEPHDEATRREYYEQFPQRLQQWLDAGSGSCLLAIPRAKEIVQHALKFFDSKRYLLDKFVTAPNHVHAIITPLAGYTLSQILHSWKSFTAHEILKLESVRQKVAEASRLCPRFAQKRASLSIWQKESFDHIVRSPASLQKFREYIIAHPS